jgi:CP family cyanate transporter-like MFS transporter
MTIAPARPVSAFGARRAPDDPPRQGHVSGERVSRLILLWVGGAALRMTVLAVPPLLPRIHRDLGLDEKAVGALTSLPVLLLAVGAVFGSLLVSRIGARRATIAGLVTIAVAGGLRGVGSVAPVLFAMTFLMGIGISVSQPAFPSLVRLWFPRRTPFAAAVYSNGLLMGEVVAAACTVAIVLPLVGGSWQRALGAWSVVVIAIAVAFTVATKHIPIPAGTVPPRWWPDWRDRQTWKLGLIFGGASIAYFSTNAFIPDFLRATHHTAYIGAALTTVNVSQIPASILVALVPGRLIGRRWPLVLVGCLTLLSGAGMALGGVWVVIWAAPLGFSSAAVLVLCLALPPLLAAPHEVHRMSAAVFTIAYACSFTGSFVAGALWDATGVPFSAFLPAIASGFAIAFLASRLDSHAMRHAATPHG